MTDLKSDLFRQLAQQASEAQCLTIGLVNGHRDGNDVRCLHRLAGQLSAELAKAHCPSSLLVCHLNIEHPFWGKLGFLEEDYEEPQIAKSPLGDWYAIDVPITLGRSAPWMLQQLPRWLPNWKQRFRLILMNLGPIHLVTSRTIGRLCDANYMLLGPNSSASADWLLQYMDYHGYCGSNIVGTIVAGFAA